MLVLRAKTDARKRWRFMKVCVTERYDDVGHAKARNSLLPNSASNKWVGYLSVPAPIQAYLGNMCCRRWSHRNRSLVEENLGQ